MALGTRHSFDSTARVSAQGDIDWMTLLFNEMSLPYGANLTYQGDGLFVVQPAVADGRKYTP